MSTTGLHPVLEELKRRKAGKTPRLKLALSIEGGGMRSVVSAGMMCALEKNGIGPDLFDAVFGASGGAFNAAYYVAEQSEQCRMGYWEDTGKELINFARPILRRKPVVDMDHMVWGMIHSKPLDFQKVLRSQKLRPLATDALSGEVVAFEPPSTQEELLQQLRASSAVPIIDRGAITVKGRKYFDAGIVERVPFETPLNEGYDAILILATHPLYAIPANSAKAAARRLLKYGANKISPVLAELALQDPKQKLEKARRLTRMTESPAEPPYAFVISPDLDGSSVGKFELKVEVIKAGGEQGFVAVDRICRALESHGL